MAGRKLILDLAQLVVAAAWADGELDNSEVNALKDLLFSLEGVTGREWAEIEVYLDSPVGPEEREKLLDDVLREIDSAADKELVVGTLRKLVEADGVVTEQEEELLREVEEAVSGVQTGVLAKLSRLMKGAVIRRDAGYRGGAQREESVDDFIKNAVYYRLKPRLEKEGVRLSLPDEEVRKLCLAAGLLARISAVDEDMSDSEKQAMREILGAEWGLNEQQARIVAEVSCDGTLKGLDYFRLANGFYACTDRAERLKFLVCLFKVANACGKTSYDEVEEIRKIANSLKLDHKDFIAAKLTIPDEDREVL